ncbi:hypothetical protein C8Q75DRAFT_811456 [Abortiporus biennis]|nr:hypothetical protein C8Q75DRAFT_811456 [Abortiporus biennis]
MFGSTVKANSPKGGANTTRTPENAGNFRPTMPSDVSDIGSAYTWLARQGILESGDSVSLNNVIKALEVALTNLRKPTLCKPVIQAAYHATKSIASTPNFEAQIIADQMARNLNTQPPPKKLEAPKEQPSWVAVAAKGSTKGIMDFSSTEKKEDWKLQQQVIAVAHRLIINVGDNDTRKFRDLTKEGARKLQVSMNEYLAAAAKRDKVDVPMVKAVISLLQGGLSLEFNTTEARDYAKKLPGKDFLHHIALSANVNPEACHIVCRFVPCDGVFNPQNEEHIAELEVLAGTPAGSISNAYWIKDPARCRVDQQFANMKVILNDRHAVNKFLTARIFIDEKPIAAAKNKHEPKRCLNC